MPNPIQITNPGENFVGAEEYLTLVEESDKALEELLQYFEQEEEPVVVCVFGNHYPKVEERFTRHWKILLRELLQKKHR